MLLHPLPLSRLAYMDMPWWHWAWSSSAPTAGWRTNGAGLKSLRLHAQVLCSETQSVECSSLDGVLPALWPDVTSLVPTRSTGTVLVSRGSLTWSQVLSAVLCESFCGERKSPPPVGDRNTGNTAFMAGSQRRWRRSVRLTKNSEGRFKFRVKPEMPGSSACLLWGAFKVPVFKWINIIFNGKKHFFKDAVVWGQKIFSLIFIEKSLTLLFLPPTFPFQQERWKKKQEKDVKRDDFFFKLKKTWSHWKYLNINKYKFANNQATNFILNETQLRFYMTEDAKKPKWWMSQILGGFAFLPP